jgi:molecular chaperone GrpE (heat shock protein)
MRKIYSKDELVEAYKKLSDQYEDITKRLEKAKEETHHPVLLLVLDTLEFLIDNVEFRKLY